MDLFSMKFFPVLREMLLKLKEGLAMAVRFLLLSAMMLSTPVFAAGDEYRVGANDLLKITVYDYPELTSELRVGESGQVSFPLIGQIDVGGKTTHDIETLISRRLVDGNFIRQAHISVLITKYSSQIVSVMGYVTRPGQYPLERTSKLIDLLAAAGGVDQAKGASKAVVLHRDGSSESIDLEALFGGDQRLNLSVADGDTIYVPKADQFYIYGEVQHPGVYRLERGMTVSQAISAGGGLTVRGTERKPHVKRRNSAGIEQELVVSGANTLQPDDIIYVNESWF